MSASKRGDFLCNYLHDLGVRSVPVLRFKLFRRRVPQRSRSGPSLHGTAYPGATPQGPESGIVTNTALVALLITETVPVPALLA